MKRKATYDYSFEPPCDPSKISPHLLQVLGKAIILWNDVEHLIDELFSSALEISADVARHISSRINGIEGKIEIIKVVLSKHGHFEDEENKPFLDTLGALMAYKQARDAIAHARLSAADGGIVPTFERKGDQFEVLVTEESLEILSEHLLTIRSEMSNLSIIASIIKYRNRITDEDANVPWDSPFAPDYNSAQKIFKRAQAQRRSLKPLLKLSEPPPPKKKKRK